MNLRRQSTSNESESFGGQSQLPFTATALHNAQSGSARNHASDEQGGISVFWRVFGGTIVSIAALAGITIYNSFNNQISELRNEIHKLNEARAELIKKDEFSSRVNSYSDRVLQLQTQNNEQNATIRAMRTELDGYKEKFTRSGMDIDAAKKDLATIEVLKEKISSLTADSKSSREDYLKLRQEVDKNLAADQDRKAHRDEQYKEIDRTMKELASSIQALQIKLARLEGATTAPVPSKPAKPVEEEKPIEPVKKTDGK